MNRRLLASFFAILTGAHFVPGACTPIPARTPVRWTYDGEEDLAQRDGLISDQQTVR